MIHTSFQTLEFEGLKLKSIKIYFKMYLNFLIMCDVWISVDVMHMSVDGHQ